MKHNVRLHFLLINANDKAVISSVGIFGRAAGFRYVYEVEAAVDVHATTAVYSVYQ